MFHNLWSKQVKQKLNAFRKKAKSNTKTPSSCICLKVVSITAPNMQFMFIAIIALILLSLGSCFSSNCYSDILIFSQIIIFSLSLVFLLPPGSSFFCCHHNTFALNCSKILKMLPVFLPISFTLNLQC